MKNKKNVFFIGCLFVFFVTSCKKDDFLGVKPQSNLVIPTTIDDFQALMENDGFGSSSGVFNVTPSIGLCSSDNFYITDNYFQANLSQQQKNIYLFAPDIYRGVGNQSDWVSPYKQILITNIVTEGLAGIKPDAASLKKWNNTYGDALFKRAYAFWNLAQVYCAPFDSSSASQDIGLPLKLTSDVNAIVQRSTIQQTYDQILSDLLTAKNLAPELFTGHLNRGSKVSICALLSRVYLSMRAYDKAGIYADSALQSYSSLIDYNTISATSTVPFSYTEVEVMYQSMCTFNSLYSASSNCFPDSTLYRSYSANDLRSSIFFRSSSAFKFGYQGGSDNQQFTGLTTSEMYLNRAESNARKGDINAAMNDLNTLLIKRWKAGTYTPVTAASGLDALNKILSERRKETVFRGLRWMDLRRLNKEGYGILIKHIVGGQIYTLAPNSPLYVFPIPPDEIALSGILQNLR